MKDTPISPGSSDESPPDTVSSPDPGASDVPASTVPPMTLEQWEASQPYYPVQRVPRTAIAHLYKGGLGKVPSWIIEPKRKYVRPDWVQIFKEAAAAHAAARADNEAKGS